MARFLPMAKQAQERHLPSQAVLKDMWTVVSFHGPYLWCLAKWPSAVITNTWSGACCLSVVSRYTVTACVAGVAAYSPACMHRHRPSI